MRNFSTKVMGITVMMLLISQVVLGQFNWIRPPENPVFPSSSYAWDSRYTYAPSVIYRDDLYRMWYSGWDGFGDNGSGIGYAISADGIHWTRNPNNPVVEGNIEPWFDNTVRAPAVTYHIDEYIMIFGTNTSGFLGSHSYFGLATSKTGLYWRVKPDPILCSGPPGSWDETDLKQSSSIVEWGGRYWIWYSAYGQQGWGIGAAYTEDFINWVKCEENPVLLPSSPGQWDGYRVHYPEVLVRNNQLEMWYSGAVGYSDRCCIGIALSSDGIHWERSELNPVFEPSQGSGWDSYRVNSPAVTYMDDMVKMWYGAVGDSSWTDWNIGMAYASLGGDENNRRKPESPPANEEPKPERAELSIQGPNPFNASTSLGFILPCDSEVSLRIYNSLGQLVDILESGMLPAGNYTRTWDANRFATGIYFAELYAGSYHQVQKLILMK